MLNIHIIGIGGTGSWLMHLLMQDKSMINNAFDIFDFDTIESKNVARQDFKHSNIGLYKVDCVAYYSANDSRMNDRFKLTRHNTKYDPKNVPDVVISCIDTIKGRNEIFRTLLNISKLSDKRIVLLDSGNEDSYGQIMTIIIDKDTVSAPKNYIELLNRSQSEVRGQGNVSCVDFEEQTATINFHQAAAIQYILRNINVAKVEANVLFTGSFLNSGCSVVNNKHKTILAKLPKNKKGIKG